MKESGFEKGFNFMMSADVETVEQLCIDNWEMDDFQFEEKYGFVIEDVAPLALNVLTKKFLLKGD